MRTASLNSSLSMLSISILSAWLFLMCVHVASAQTSVGQISGTITDSTGAVMPSATITVTNEATGLVRTATGDESGFYVITNLPAGTYTVAIERGGFKRFIQSGNNLVADGRLTIDRALTAGDITETVEVTDAIGETVNTTSGEVARVIDSEQIQNLALDGRNYMQLTTLIPGAPELQDDQLEATTSLNVSQSINGNRGGQNNLTIDGGSNLDAGSNTSQVNNVGIDYIQEVKIQTSNFSAEYGRQAGAAINVVTKGGGNRFRGSLFEFFRNDVLDARDYFSPFKRKLRYNDFGYSLGGPIIKGKFFFFGGQEWNYIRRTNDPVRRTLPTRAERRGDYSFRLRGPDGTPGTADDGVLRIPGNPLGAPCTGPTIVSGVVTVNAVRTGCFPGNIIPQSPTVINGRSIPYITADGRAIARVFDAMEGLAAVYRDTPTGNNAIYQRPNPFDSRRDNFRLDYRFNSNHNIFLRYLHDSYDLVDPFGTFINAELPTIPTQRTRPSNGAQLSYVWSISPNLVNEAKVNAAWLDLRATPTSDYWKRDTYGFAFAQQFDGGRFDQNGIPNVTFEGTGGVADFRGPAGSIVALTTDIAFTDNLTFIRGKHTTKAGVLLIRNRKDQNARPAYTGAVTFNPTGNNNSTGQSFADGLLGNYRSYTEAQNEYFGFFRFTQFEAYLSDNWRLRRNLSLELGVRYYNLQPIYTQANNLATFYPSLYDPARAVRLYVPTVLPGTNTVRAVDPRSVQQPNFVPTNQNTSAAVYIGNIVPGSGDRYNGLISAGQGVPPDELGRVPNGSSSLVLSTPVGAPRGLYNHPGHLFAPRVSFAYSPFKDSRTALRGGFGIFYDRAQGNIIYNTASNPPFGISAQFENGNLNDLQRGQPDLISPFGQVNAIDRDFKLAYTLNYSLGLQRELPFGVFAELTYVGNLGRHLLRQPDINQPSFAVLRERLLGLDADDSDTATVTPQDRRPDLNSLRPYLGFSQIRMYITDSNSNYNALQLYLAKRKGNLRFTTSYTWSKALTDASGDSETSEDSFSRRFNYGPASYDRRHILVSTYTYTLPFFRRSQSFFAKFLKGYEISGITRFQSGRGYTILGDNVLGGGRRAEYIAGEAVELPDGERNPERWFNTQAFRAAPNGRRGSSGISAVRGPGLQRWDISLRRRFPFRESRALEFRADLFNAFNRTNFTGMNVNRSQAAFGTLTGSAPARNIQFGLRLNF
ncbi:MAG: carboxypeptidase regulatory-like domain-containing protein [Acidobacteriota bacterium]|nr:carboxypeptidase regulatory-like domain-containing protein [Acidobacteriota bacterium]